MGKAIISKNFIAWFVALVAVLTIVGHFTPFSFTRYYWFEETLHFMGGVWLAAVFLYFFKNRSDIFDIKKNFLATLTFVLGFTALVGIGWEFFEYLVWLFLGGGIIITLPDTMLDLFLDFAGALLLSLVWRVSR